MAVVTSNVGSAGKVTFKVTLDSGDPLDWGVYISSKTDFGQGMSARGADYPYYVTEYHGSGNKSFDLILKPAQYVGELALRGIGVVDFSTFEIKVSYPKPTIYNACWSTGGGACTQPAVTAGKTVDIRADIANSGPAGEVLCGFKIDGVNKYAENNLNLVTFSDPTHVIWTVWYRGFVMPSSNVTLEIVAMYLDGSGNWVQTDSQKFTISTSIPGCSTLSLSPPAPVVNQVGDKVTLTASATPENVPFTVTFKDKDTGAVYGTCKTSGTGTVGSGTGNTCTFAWDSTGKTVGQNYNVIATTNSCISTASVIQIMPAIEQANLTVKVLDNETGLAVLGATVLATPVGSASQTRITDSNGYALFRLNFGTINLAVSKNGYNTTNDVWSLFADKSVTEYLVPVPVVPTTGSLMFVSVPVGAKIFIDSKDTGQVTTATIDKLTAGAHKYTLKYNGYNDSNGDVTVQAGGLVTVPVTMTVQSPSTGAVLVNSNPMGAEIFIDSMDTGQTTSGMATVSGIPPGQHTLLLKMSGFQDKSMTFSVTAGQTTNLLLELIPLVTIGELDIDSEPSGARIYINDKDTGYATPSNISNLKEGDYTYKVILSGYKDVAGGFTITPKEITKVHVVFEKAGIGVEAGTGIILAGVAVVGLMIASDKQKVV